MRRKRWPQSWPSPQHGTLLTWVLLWYSRAVPKGGGTEPCWWECGRLFGMEVEQVLQSLLLWWLCLLANSFDHEFYPSWGNIEQKYSMSHISNFGFFFKRPSKKQKANNNNKTPKQEELFSESYWIPYTQNIIMPHNFYKVVMRCLIVQDVVLPTVSIIWTGQISSVHHDLCLVCTGLGELLNSNWKHYSKARQNYGLSNWVFWLSGWLPTGMLVMGWVLEEEQPRFEECPCPLSANATLFCVCILCLKCGFRKWLWTKFKLKWKPHPVPFYTWRHKIQMMLSHLAKITFI